jgi:hypothetical protein
LLLRHFPECTVNTVEGRFPYVMDVVEEDSVVCFMGCNQLAMLFNFSVDDIVDKVAKAQVMENVDFCLDQLGDRWFFFVEKNREDPPHTPLTIHSMSAMSRSNYADLDANPFQKLMHRVNKYVSQYASKKLRKRRSKDGVVMYKKKCVDK